MWERDATELAKLLILNRTVSEPTGITVSKLENCFAT